MSGRYPPLECRKVKKALMFLGFMKQAATSGTSHEYYVGTFRGRYRKVTVDCPQAPFSQYLIASMASAAGLTKKELYAAVAEKKPADWP